MTAPTTAPSTLIGRKVGNYRIRRLLGEGGMGSVYLAENPKIESRVAIKVLHNDHVVNAGMVKRFMDEARAVNRVGHPGTVRIHDFGAQEDVGVYLVMELLEGSTLRQALNECGSMTPARMERIMAQAASALDDVHQKEIVHRDLKPENIFLVPDAALPSGTRVKILDFGIAKLSEEKSALGSSTITGVVFGSPSYMSPEQCCDTKNVDQRTDVYSMGVIAYELLSGQLPYLAETIGELVRQHLTQQPLPPSAHNGEVSPALDRVIMQALAIKPKERYGTMASFANDLARVLGREPALHTPAAPAAEQAADVSHTARTAAIIDRPQLRQAATPPAPHPVDEGHGGADEEIITEIPGLSSDTLAEAANEPARRGTRRWLTLLAALLVAGLGAWGVQRMLVGQPAGAVQQPVVRVSPLPPPAAVAPPAAEEPAVAPSADAGPAVVTPGPAAPAPVAARPRPRPARRKKPRRKQRPAAPAAPRPAAKADDEFAPFKSLDSPGGGSK